MHIEIVRVESPEGRRLLEEFRQQGFVMLVGSAVSEWKDSNLPTGKSMTEALAELLSDGLVSKETVKLWIAAAAFEHIMEGCPNHEALGANLVQLFSAKSPNPLHIAIADLVRDRIIEHIITTNYDADLETACSIQCTATQPPAVIVTESEARNFKPLRSAIFKIHGCVEHDQLPANQSSTMVYALRAEGELVEWKRQVLYRLAAGRRLLVCGYSGRDFEICPELSRLQDHIVWNTWNPQTGGDDLTPNARRVLSDTNGVALVGDMRKVLAQLQQANSDYEAEPIPAERSTSLSTEVIAAICQNLTDWELQLWRVRTFVAIGAATEGIQLAKSMLLNTLGDSTRRFDALLNLGRSQFHAGKYKQAIQTYKQAVALGEQERQRQWIMQSRSDLFEALRCHGNWWQARKELAKLQAASTSNEFWAIAFRSVLLLRYLYQLAKAIRIFPGKVQQLRNKCKNLLTVVVQHAKNEQWLELQQAELWADRMDIRFAELYNGPLNPLPSKDGYKQLGYLIPQSMALRDDLVRKQGDTEENVGKLVDALAEAGALAELWKLVRAGSRFKKRNLITKEQRRIGFRAWWACEYTVPMRLFVSIFD